MDAADGHHRDGNGRAHLGKQLPGDDVDVLFGVGGEHGPAAQIIGPVGKGLLGLRHVVGRYADDLVRAQQPPRLGSGHILLPDVDAVGVAELGQRDVVVEDEGDVVRFAQSADLPRLGQQGGIVQLFFPQLDHGGPALQGGFHLPGEGLAVYPGTVGHGVKTKHFRGAVHKAAPLV